MALLNCGSKGERHEWILFTNFQLSQIQQAMFAKKVFIMWRRKRKTKAYKFNRIDIHEEAILALYYSSAKKFGKEEVIYTDVKNIQKLKGGAPGKVSIASGKTILISLEGDVVSKALSPSSQHTWFPLRV